MNSQLALHLALARQAGRHRTAAERRRARLPVQAGSGTVAALFAALFAAQAGLLSLGPVLPDVAREFGVSTAAAGQLRTLGGLAGGVTAIAVALFGSRLGLRGTLIAGHLMLALGTLASAAAPNLVVLAAGQAAVGGAAGLLIAGALAASAAWSDPGRRGRAPARLCARACRDRRVPRRRVARFAASLSGPFPSCCPMPPGVARWCSPRRCSWSHIRS